MGDTITAVRWIGEPFFARNAEGKPISRIATVFPRRGVVVTIPGIHAWQREAWIQKLGQERGRPLAAEEESAELAQSVDLILEPDLVLIRPHPEDMPLAFEADDLLQKLMSKRQIRFLHVLDERVQAAIKARGELWRISPLPQTGEEMQRMIRESRERIAGDAIYYFNRITGARYLTFFEFSRLEALPAPALAQHLAEIQEYSKRRNRLGEFEVCFLGADPAWGPAAFAGFDFLRADENALRERYRELKQRFEAAVPPELRRDQPEDPAWRTQMMKRLLGGKGEHLTEAVLQGLSPEFYLQIHWLPGGRFEEGEFIFDTVYDEFEDAPGDPELADLCDPKARRFIFNFIREFGDLEYVNVGRVESSLSLRAKMPGRRAVYIAELKLRMDERRVARILRIQKWGIHEHLEAGKGLLQAMLEAEEYTEYILDRRLGCRQLGMNLSTRIVQRKIFERYQGKRTEYFGCQIGSTYFEREYIFGVASDKVPRSRLEQPEYAVGLARLLGRAAAPNIIVGRTTLEKVVIFDDGDEVVVEDENGWPKAIVVSDHTGTFVDFASPLEQFAEAYARPVNARLPHLPNPALFARTYIAGFTEQFLRVQGDYRRRRRAFDTLFQHEKQDPGSFAFRWLRVLSRLDQTDGRRLAERIQGFIKV